MEKLLNRLRVMGVELGLENDRLTLNIPAGMETAGILEEVRLQKQELIEYIRNAKQVYTESATEGSWFNQKTFEAPAEDTQRFEPFEAPAPVAKEYIRYCVVGPFANNLVLQHMHQELNTAAFEQALQWLLERHESLRCTVFLRHGTVYQQTRAVFSAAELIHFTDVAHLPEKDAVVQSIVERETKRKFNLEKGPLLAVHIVRYSDRLTGVLLVIHHIVSDEETLRIIEAELQHLYQQALGNKLPPLPPLPVQFREYAIWVRRFSHGEEAGEARRFFIEQVLNSLQENDEPISGYTDAYHDVLFNELERYHIGRNSELAVHAIGRLVNIYVPPGSIYTCCPGTETLNRLQQFAQQQHTSVFTILLAAMAITLGRFQKQQNQRIYIPFSGRVTDTLAPLTGWLTGEVILCLPVPGEISAHQLFADTANRLSEAARYRFFPHEELLAITDLPLRVLAPAFINYIQANQSTAPEPGAFHEENGSGHFPFACTITTYPNGICFKTHYNNTLYTPADIELIFNRFFSLLQWMPHNAHEPLLQFSY
ncbi:MAG: hypothetical protein JNM68_05225 [Dinghuibacter sp.]|nr:hypothetical protein [Dinghuibacter sp.]